MNPKGSLNTYLEIVCRLAPVCPPLADAPCPLRKGVDNTTCNLSISDGDAISINTKSVIEPTMLNKNNPSVSA